MLSPRKLKYLRTLVGYPVGIAEHDKITYTRPIHYELAEEFAKFGIRLYIGRAYKKEFKRRPTTPPNDRGIAHRLYSDLKPGIAVCVTTIKQLEEYLEYLKENFGGKKSWETFFQCKEYEILTLACKPITGIKVLKDYTPYQIRSANHSNRRLYKLFNRENCYRYDLFNNYFILEIN